MAKRKKEIPPFYRLLGVSPNEDYSRAEIVRHYVEELRSVDRTGRTPFGAFTRESCDLIANLKAAAQTLGSPGAQAEYDEVGHDAWIATHGLPTVSPNVNWVCLAVEELVIAAEERRVGEVSAIRCIVGAYKQATEALPQFIAADTLHDIPDLSPEAVLRVMLDETTTPDGDIRRVSEQRFPELSWLRSQRIRWVWWAIGPDQDGRKTLGQARALPLKERQLWPDRNPPLFEVLLALDWWMVATPEERRRLIHHELMHLALSHNKDGEPRPKIRKHDVEEFVLTATRFGAADEVQTRLMDALAKHPRAATATPQLTLLDVN